MNDNWEKKDCKFILKEVDFGDITTLKEVEIDMAPFCNEEKKVQTIEFGK